MDKDPARILPMVMALARVWMKNPEWRFGQLINNVAFQDLDPSKLYLLKDETLIKALQEFSAKQALTDSSEVL